MGALPDDWTLPGLTPWNREWFTSGCVAVQRCAACSTLQHPPEEVCHRCGSLEFGHEVLSPRGTVHSLTVVHYAAHPRLADAVPYVVALVSLDGAPHLRVLANVIDAAPADVRIGSPVEAAWEERTAADGTVVRLLQWRLA